VACVKLGLSGWWLLWLSLSGCDASDPTIGSNGGSSHDGDGSSATAEQAGSSASGGAGSSAVAGAGSSASGGAGSSASGGAGSSASGGAGSSAGRAEEGDTGGSDASGATGGGGTSSGGGQGVTGGSNGAGPPEVEGSIPTADLTEAQKAALCDWQASVLGGYGHTSQCGMGSRTFFADQATCVANAFKAFCEKASAGQFIDCVTSTLPSQGCNNTDECRRLYCM